MDFAPPPPPPPAKSAERIKDFCLRGITVGQLVNFFEKYCGDVVFDDSECLRPTCMATKLARLCTKQNQTNRESIATNTCRELHPNLYAVNSLFIVPQTEKAGRVSMAEMWNPDGLLILYFISHYWGEDFGEFVQSTYRFALSEAYDKSLAPGSRRAKAFAYSLYVCAFSNNQHNIKDELGAGLEDSPFYRILSADTTKKVFMNLDQSALALMRAWCSFEFCIATELGKPFELNTRFGPLRDLRVIDHVERLWISHMFHLLQDVDISKAQASNLKDLEMIKAKVDSFKGGGSFGVLTGKDALNMVLKSSVASGTLPVFAKSGDAAGILMALDCRADANSVDTCRISALTYMAAHDSDACIIEDLIEAGADPERMEMAADVVQMWSCNLLDCEAAIARVEANRTAAKIHASSIKAARKNLETLKLINATHSLHNPDPTVREACCRQIGALGPDAAPYVKEVAALLTDDSDMVQVAAANALGNIGSAAAPAALPYLQGSSPNRKRITRQVTVSLLGVFDEDAGEYCAQVLKLLDREDWQVRVAALHALARFGHQSSPFWGNIAPLLNDDDGDVRIAALQALAGIANEQGRVAEVVAMLSESQWKVRVAALQALAQIEAQDLVALHMDSICCSLRDNVRDVRHAAARALGRLGSLATPAVPALQSVLAREEAFEVRHAAKLAVSSIQGSHNMA